MLSQETKLAAIEAAKLSKTRNAYRVVLKLSGKRGTCEIVKFALSPTHAASLAQGDNWETRTATIVEVEQLS